MYDRRTAVNFFIISLGSELDISNMLSTLSYMSSKEVLLGWFVTFSYVSAHVNFLAFYQSGKKYDVKTCFPPPPPHDIHPNVCLLFFA